MIKVYDIDEYCSLMSLHNYCKQMTHCDNCEIKCVCNCMSIIPCELSIEYENKEVKDDE